MTDLLARSSPSTGANASETDPVDLLSWVQGCADRHHHAYLLLDGAQAEGSHRILQTMHVPYLSLFEGKREEALLEIAPLLVEVTELEVPRRQRLVSWASQLGFRMPCLSWYESRLTAQVMAAHLRNFHRVGLSEGQAMMMRWYDTRILPIWLEALLPPQRALFAGCLSGIAFIDRFGEARTIHAGDGAGPASEALPLEQPLFTLDDRQFGLLVDAGDLDALVSHLRFVIPDETRQLSSRMLIEFVAAYRQQAVTAGLDDIDRQTQYVLLALYTSGRGTEHPLMLALMNDPPNTLDDYYAAMQAMPAEVWEAGPPLWPRAPSE